MYSNLNILCISYKYKLNTFKYTLSLEFQSNPTVFITSCTNKQAGRKGGREGGRQGGKAGGREGGRGKVGRGWRGGRGKWRGRGKDYDIVVL